VFVGERYFVAWSGCVTTGWYANSTVAVADGFGLRIATGILHKHKRTKRLEHPKRTFPTIPCLRNVFFHHAKNRLNVFINYLPA
jgi:hypothetical protein